MERIRTRQFAESGFSLLELMIVILIIMVVAAIAIPNVMNAIYEIRLRSSANSVAGVMLDARLLAIRNNSYYPVKSDVTGGSTIFYVDANRDGNWQDTEPTVQLSGGVKRTYTNPDTSGVSKPWSFNARPLTNDPYQGARGVPCVVSGSVCLQTESGGAGVSITAGYLVILTDSRATPAFMAVSLSPGGRVRSWRWDPITSAWK